MNVEWFTAVVGLVGSFVGALLALLTLIRLIDRALDKRIDERVSAKLEKGVMSVLIRAGLAKDGQEHGTTWANGSHNLPDSLRNIWQAIEGNQGEIHALRNDFNRHQDRQEER